MNLENKKVVIVGFGKTGFAVANFLLNKKANVFITDIEETREKIENLKKLNRKVEFEFGKHSSSFLKGSDLIIISPGVDEKILPEIVNEEKIPVISEIELSYNFSPSKKIIAITGTNKSPELFPIMHILGIDKVLIRIDNAIEKLKE